MAIKQQATQDTVQYLRDVIQMQRRKTEYLNSIHQQAITKQQAPLGIKNKKSESNIFKHQPIQIMINNQPAEEFEKQKDNGTPDSPETDKSGTRKKSVRFSEDILSALQKQNSSSQNPDKNDQGSPTQNNKQGSDDEGPKKKGSTTSLNNLRQNSSRKKMNPAAKQSQQLMSSQRQSSVLNIQPRNPSFMSTQFGQNFNKRFSQSRIELMHREMEAHQSEEKSQFTTSSEEENLPYPYNALPEQNWFELKQQLKKVNELLNKADKDNFSEKPLKKSVPLHSKIFAARLLSISQNRSNTNLQEDDQSSMSQNQKILNEIGLSEYSQNQNRSSRNGSRQRLSSKKTIIDPYQCTPGVQKKWRKLRNLILIVVRLLKIHNNVLLYGTSEKLLDINRGISKVRDIMIPEARNYKIIDFSKNQPTDIFMWIPESILIRSWQTIIIFLLLYTAIIVPYKIALIDDDSNLPLFYLDTVIDFMFIFDMYVSFNTPIEFKPENFNFNRKDICLNYLKSWFLIDLMASIPMNLIQFYLIPKEYNFKGQDLIRIARLPRLYRLFRLVRLFKIGKIFKSSYIFLKIMQFFKLNNSAVRLTTFFITVFLCVHITGCLWILAATLSDQVYDTWIYRNDLQDADNYTIYLAAVYWAFQTLLTVGYGDISAQTNEEMIIAVLWMIIGSFFYTFTIGNLTSVISNQNTRQSQINDRVNIINQFCKETNLDRTLTNKLRGAIQYITNKNFVWADKIKIFEELPPSIKSEIAKEMHQGIIKKIRFFDDKDNNFIGSIVPLLTPLKTFRHEVIYKKQNHPNAIFFITQGRVSFFIERKNIAFKDMIEGCYFGDIEIIFKRKRKFTVISASDSDFLTLSKSIFEDIIIRDYPEIHEEMAMVAYEREKRIREAKKMALVEYKTWKENQVVSEQDEQEDTEIIIDEQDIYKLINHNQDLEEMDENDQQQILLMSMHQSPPENQDKQQAFRRELSRINESSEKDNTQSNKNSQSSNNKSRHNDTLQPKKGILKKIKLVVKTDQNLGLDLTLNNQRQSNLEAVFIQDREPVEQKLNLMSNNLYNDQEKRFISKQDENKRESSMTANSLGQNQFQKQKSTSRKPIKKSIASNLSIEKRNSFYINDRNMPSGRKMKDNFLSPNIGAIFKANQQQFSKTLNEDDEEIMGKVRTSKRHGRMSKKNLNKLILKQQRSQDEDEEDQNATNNIPTKFRSTGNGQGSLIHRFDNHKSKGERRKLNQQRNGKINSAQKFDQSSSSDSSYTSSFDSSDSSQVQTRKRNKKLTGKIKSPQFTDDEDQLKAEEDSDGSSMSGPITNSIKSGAFQFRSNKKKNFKLNESIRSFKSQSTKTLNSRKQKLAQINLKLKEQSSEDQKPKILLKEKFLNARSETMQNVRNKLSGKLNVEDLLRQNTLDIHETKKRHQNQRKDNDANIKSKFGNLKKDSLMRVIGIPKPALDSAYRSSSKTHSKTKNSQNNHLNQQQSNNFNLEFYINNKILEIDDEQKINDDSPVRNQNRRYIEVNNMDEEIREDQQPLIDKLNQSQQQQVVDFLNNDDDDEEQQKLDKMRRNLQKDMDRLSNKLQKQTLSQRSLEFKIDNIGDTINTLLGQLVIIKENMQIEEEYQNGNIVASQISFMNNKQNNIQIIDQNN